jgi:hypothetical protein
MWKLSFVARGFRVSGSSECELEENPLVVQ